MTATLDLGHNGSVCPGGARGSRATSFWSQTTTTLSGGAAKDPRGAPRPPPEGPVEGARVLVAQQERHLGHGQPAVAQEWPRQVVADLGEHCAKRRPLLAQPALERPGAHPECPRARKRGLLIPS